MKKIRLVARMEVKGRHVVKGVRMEGLRRVGTPEDLTERYYRQGADELVYIDTVASLYGRNNLGELVGMASDSIFVPLTVGGGVRSLDDFYRMLGSGADKIAVNTHAHREPGLITEAAKTFGSQCVIASVESKTRDGIPEAFADNGRERMGKETVAWCRELEDRGAGEILLISVDRDGTARGADVELVRAVTEAVSIPVIAGGGVGSADDVVRLVQATEVSAVALSHVLHFARETIAGIKTALLDAGIQVRPLSGLEAA